MCPESIADGWREWERELLRAANYGRSRFVAGHPLPPGLGLLVTNGEWAADRRADDVLVQRGFKE